VIDEERLRELSPAERLSLIRALVAIDGPAGSQPSSRRRAAVLVLVVVCCLVLAAWIGILAVTLPRYYRSGGWRGAWVGFDLALLAAFAVTGWAAWKRRQVLIICLIVLATLLCCDAWFDVVLDARTQGFELSLMSAVFIELPLAAIAILGARRLLRMSIAVVRRYEGQAGPQPRLRHVPLVVGHAGFLLSHLLAENDPAEAVCPPVRAAEPAPPETLPPDLDGHRADAELDAGERHSIEKLIAGRAAARQQRDWARADEIRAELDRRSVVVTDTPEGPVWELR
jgi:hypothetical protein